MVNYRTGNGVSLTLKTTFKEYLRLKILDITGFTAKLLPSSFDLAPFHEDIICLHGTDNERSLSMLGTILYMAVSTRPDISVAVSFLETSLLSQAMRHFIMAERVLRYFSGQSNKNIIISE